MTRQIDRFHSPQGNSARAVAFLTLLLAVVFLAAGCAPRGEGDDASENVELSAESLDQALLVANPIERSGQVSALLGVAQPEDLELVKDAFGRAILPQGSIEYALFGAWWAGFDPLMAFAYADGELRTDHPAVILAVVREWARRDPIGAIESDALNDLDSKIPVLRQGLQQVFVSGWFQSGTPGLEDWIISQEDPRAIRWGLEYYAQNRVIRDGPEATLEWARTAQFEHSDRVALIAGALAVVSHQNPQIAADWLPNAEAEGIDARMLVGPISKAWAHHAPADAANWTLGFPESPSRDAALRTLLKTWIRRSEPSFTAWLDENEPNAPSWFNVYRNDAIRAHVRNNHYHVDWEDLLVQVEKIKVPELQDRLRVWLLQRWNVADSAATSAWLDANESRFEGDLRGRLSNIPLRNAEEVREALRLP